MDSELLGTRPPPELPSPRPADSGSGDETPDGGVPLDARFLNWRFVVPNEPDGLLLLPLAGERIPGAVVPMATRTSFHTVLSSQPFPAVSAPDLKPWADFVGGPRRLVALLADAVLPGGWLYMGFSNRLYPPHALAGGSLRTAWIERTLRERGFRPADRYVVFPNHRRAAYLVSARHAAELDYFLRRLAFPYADTGSGLFGRAETRLLALMLRGAIAAPNALRVRLAPAFAYVAVRRDG